MSGTIVGSDEGLLEMFRTRGPLGVTEIARQTHVTATAVRQRLTRMMARGLIEREAIRNGRGRPRHRYQLTKKGLRLTGSNFVDLAMVLWRSVRSIEDPELRKTTINRVLTDLTKAYAGQVSGQTTAERMESLTRLLRQREVPFSVEELPDLPVLIAHACPYPELAEEDRSICRLEKILFSELLHQDVDLAECRLDGAARCRFKPR